MRRLVPLFLLAACSIPGRDELHGEQKQLDAQLVQKRAIARNLRRYREEAMTMTDRIEAARPLVQAPDFDELRSAVAPLGFRLYPLERKKMEGYELVPIRLEASDPERLHELFDLLEQRLPSFSLSSIVFESGAVESYVDFYQRTPLPPRAMLSPPIPARWSDCLNRNEIEINREKRAEVQQLDLVIGDVDSFTALKHELYSILAVVDRAKVNAPLMEVVDAFRAAPDADLDNVSFTASREGATVRGTFHPETLRFILVPRWKLESSSKGNVHFFRYLRERES